MLTDRKETSTNLIARRRLSYDERGAKMAHREQHHPLRGRGTR